MMRTICLLVLSCLISTSSYAQEITVFPGFWGPKYYQDNERISSRDVGNIIVRDREAAPLWKKSNRHMTISWVALGAQTGMLAWQLTNVAQSRSQTVPFVGVLGAGAVSLGYLISASRLKEKAILTYNASHDTSYLRLGTTQNGAGLVLTF